MKYYSFSKRSVTPEGKQERSMALEFDFSAGLWGMGRKGRRWRRKKASESRTAPTQQRLVFRAAPEPLGKDDKGAGREEQLKQEPQEGEGALSSPAPAASSSPCRLMSK